LLLSAIKLPPQCLLQPARWESHDQLIPDSAAPTS
jgi:hypothetical protein